MKVLINSCYGGLGYSLKAIKMYLDAKGVKYTNELIDSYSLIILEDGTEFSYYSIRRDDPTIIQIFEEIGSKECSGDHSKLTCVEIPDGCNYYVDEYDGYENIEYWVEATFDEVKNGLSPEKLNILRKSGTLKLQEWTAIVG